MGAPRITAAIQRVLLLFLAEPARERYGLEISRQAEMHRGTLYRALMRMEEVGWLESEWEDVDPAVAGRPPRRLYRLTPSGLKQAEDVRSGLATAMGGQLGIGTL